MVVYYSYIFKIQRNPQTFTKCFDNLLVHVTLPQCRCFVYHSIYHCQNSQILVTHHTALLSQRIELPDLPWGCSNVIISMADQPSSTAANKPKKNGGSLVKFVRDLIKRPNKSGNNSTSQSNLTKASVASAAHRSAQGNDAGIAEPTASSKYVDFILV